METGEGGGAGMVVRVAAQQGSAGGAACYRRNGAQAEGGEACGGEKAWRLSCNAVRKSSPGGRTGGGRVPEEKVA